MSEEEQIVAHEDERAGGGETAREEFVVPADLEAYFDRVEAEKGERAAAEAALDEAQRRSAAQADRSMHLTDTARETVNGALARIGADLNEGKDAGEALEGVKKEIVRLETEQRAALVALRNELPPVAQPAESTPPETPAAEMSAPEPAAAEALAANPADAWNAGERAAVSAYLDVLDAADRAHADLMKAKRELKKVTNTETDEWEIKADQVTALEKAWRDQKADARAREQALGPIDATLVDLDVGRKAGREALRKRMTEAAPPVVPEPRDASATSVAAEQPIVPETQPDAEPANHEYARLAGELDALIGKYGPMNGMDLAFKDIMDRMARIRLGGPVQMARVSAEAQTAFQTFARDYARAVRTIKELTADGARLTEEQARSTGVTLQKMEQAAQKLAGPMTSNLQGGMRRFADALRGADPRYDSAPLVKAATFVAEQSKRIAEDTARIRSEWNRATSDSGPAATEAAHEPAPAVSAVESTPRVEAVKPIRVPEFRPVAANWKNEEDYTRDMTVDALRDRLQRTEQNYQESVLDASLRPDTVDARELEELSYWKWKNEAWRELLGRKEAAEAARAEAQKHLAERSPEKTMEDAAEDLRWSDAVVTGLNEAMQEREWQGFNAIMPTSGEMIAAIPPESPLTTPRDQEPDPTPERGIRAKIDAYRTLVDVMSQTDPFARPPDGTLRDDPDNLMRFVRVFQEAPQMLETIPDADAPALADALREVAVARDVPNAADMTDAEIRSWAEQLTDKTIQSLSEKADRLYGF